MGSGLGMNAGTADGIYSQSHLVSRLLRCLIVLLNTASMFDFSLNRGRCGQGVCVDVVLTLLQRSLASWPRTSCNDFHSTDSSGLSECVIHPLMLTHADQGPLSRPKDSSGDAVIGCRDAENENFLAVRVNVPNTVREEAYISASLEVLCGHTCFETYEAHSFAPATGNGNGGPDVRIRLLSARGDNKMDISIDRVLTKLLKGIQSDHFKIALRCIACFEEKGMALLRRYFLTVPDELWVEGGEMGDQPCRFRRGCSHCESYAAKREGRLDELVGSLRSARGSHWNSRVRASAGELLDRLVEMLF